MNRNIFICYRRDDTAQAAGRVRDFLASHFGSSRVFKDVDRLRAGQNWRHQVEQAIRGAAVVVLLIGRRWIDLAASAKEGSGADAIAFELETAARFGVPILPVLTDGAAMPRADELPPELHQLADQHALPLRDGDFKYDAARLLEHVAEFVGKVGVHQRVGLLLAPFAIGAVLAFAVVQAAQDGAFTLASRLLVISISGGIAAVIAGVLTYLAAAKGIAAHRLLQDVPMAAVAVAALSSSMTTVLALSWHVQRIDEQILLAFPSASLPAAWALSELVRLVPSSEALPSVDEAEHLLRQVRLDPGAPRGSDFVSARLDDSTMVTMWPRSHGDSLVYGLRYGRLDASYFGNDATYKRLVIRSGR